jgi:hypothetical protein
LALSPVVAVDALRSRADYGLLRVGKVGVTEVNGCSDAG